jgi:cytochrome c oxidase cbb3-type subunit 1
MEWFVKRFMKASVTWLALGVTLGVAMAVHPPWTVLRPVHLHMNLVGFVAMMIFGVAYHVVPRFAGFPLHSRRLAGLHWWLANAGLALLVTGMAIRTQRVGQVGHTIAGILAGTGGTITAAGAFIFAWIVWRTIDGPRKPPAGGARAARGVAASAAGHGLPVAGERRPGSTTRQA